jgi:hypothetical protein
LTKNPTHHARTKHIDVQHHFVWKRVENGEDWFEYYPTEHMVADVFTKALSKKWHHNFSFHAFGVCFKPYKDLWSLHTICSSPWCMNPWGCSM